MTQGLFSVMVAAAAPKGLRGTAFGVFNFVAGIAALAASLLAGGLWKISGPSLTFLAGAGFSGLALVALLGWRHFQLRESP
jgi:MFS family permease